MCSFCGCDSLGKPASDHPDVVCNQGFGIVARQLSNLRNGRSDTPLAESGSRGVPLVRTILQGGRVWLPASQHSDEGPMDVRVGGKSLMTVAKKLRAGVRRRAADRNGAITRLEKLPRQRSLIRRELLGIKRVG